ncbi:MAG: STT3 domain-containing protein [Candidatus Odinarchaeota archaeon]
MVKISTSLKNFRDRIRTSISVKTSNIIFFIAIFLLVTLAILIRLSPLSRGITLIKAFDPWIQWYNAEYLNEHTWYEYFNWTDYKSWYPAGYYRGGLRPGLTFTVVGIYKIFHFFGLPVSLYDICFYFPAFMGGITVLVMYYLGKEVLNRATGLFAAFFLAFNPGYLQRTTAGFFDNETIGVFASLMTFLFFLKAVRGGKFTHSIIGGISLGYLSLSWGGFQFGFLILPIICVILILTNKYNENVLISYAGVQGTGLLIYSLYVNFNYESLFKDLEIGGIFAFTIIIIIFHLIYTKKKEHPKLYENLINIIKWGFLPAVLVIAVIIWISPEILPFGFGSRFWTILNPLFRENVALVASVAEQMPSAWSVFYYNTLIPLILVPLGVFFCFKRLYAADIFVIIFIILMYYFTGSMIRIILIFAPAAALAGAYGLVSILRIFGSFLGERKVGISRKRRRQIKESLGSTEVFAVYIIVGFLCIAQVVHTSNIAVKQMSFAQIVPGGSLHDWEDSLTWMKNNLEGTDVVVSWWDYGYWLTPIGNVTTVNDNATMNATRIGLTGMALMQTNEIYSAKAFKRLHADYVLVYWGFLYPNLGGDEGKWTWMLQICNDHYAAYKQMGMEENNWAENAVFDESKYQNWTSGLREDLWFESQLVKLMLGYEQTTTGDLDERSLAYYYANYINNYKDDDGDLWVSHIPENGQYNSMVFIPEYFSTNHLVKLYRIDYTVLDSKFFIKNPEVFDNGYATLQLQNTGTKDLLINSVKINGVEYPYSIGSGNNSVQKGTEEIVWIDTKGSNFQKDDIVKINITAQSEALAGRQYVFTNSTSNFFVKEAEAGAIKINKENSKVIQKNSTNVDIYLEVENIGESTVNLDRFYLNNDTLENTINQTKIEYLSGSTILKPTEKANVFIADITADFYPISTFNKIGVSTPNNYSDEVLFTSSIENFSLSILNQDRILSPENLATIKGNFRKHIPIDLDESFAYTTDSGTTTLNLKLKNTGDIVFGFESIKLTESLVNISVSPQILRPDEETLITVDVTSVPGISGEINEEILVCITGTYGNSSTVVTSDIGYIHTINNKPNIQIIDSVENVNVSYIYSNETGKLVVKNTGNAPISLTNISVNSEWVSNINYLYGDSTLDIQECAIVSFDIPNLKINDSDECFVGITTNTSFELNQTLYAYTDPIYYNIIINDGETSADINGDLIITINNNGLLNVTLDSVYINNTYFSLDAFSIDRIEIESGESSVLTIDITDILAKITFTDGDKLEILVRTQEGAEDIHEEVVVP